MIVDAWGQHPTLRHAQHEMFASLRRWNRQEAPTEQLPLSETLRAMDRGGVDRMLISAWHGPGAALISNDEVAGFVGESGGRLVGVGSVNLARPMDAAREVRRCAGELGFKAIRVLPWLWGLPPTDRLFYPVYTVWAATRCACTAWHRPASTLRDRGLE